MTKVKTNDIQLKAITTTGTAPNLEVSIPREDYTSLVDQKLLLKIHDDCNANVTINVNGLGAKDLYDTGNNPIDNLKSGQYIEVMYNGTNFTFLRFQDAQTATSQKVLSLTRTDQTDYDLYTVNGVGISSYSETDFFVVKVEGTNYNGVSKINIDGLGEKYIYTPSGDNLKEQVLNVDNTYLLRYDESLDAFTIMETGNVNVTNNYNDNFVDLKAYDTQVEQFTARWNDPDLFKYGYDGEQYLHLAVCKDGIAYSVKRDTFTDTEVTHFTGRDNGTDQDAMTCYNEGYVYLYERGRTLYKINSDDYSLIQQITTEGTGEGRNVYVGNYVWVLTKNADGIYKYDKNFNYLGNVSGIDAPNDGGKLYEKEGYLYSLIDTGKVYKIDIDSNTIISYVSISSCLDIEVTFDNYIIVTTTGSTIYKYDIELNLLGTLDMGENLYGSNRDGGNVVDSQKGYVVINSQSGKYFKVDYYNLQIIGSPLIIGNDPQIMALCGNYIYSTENGTANLFKIGTDVLTAPPSGYFRLYFKSDGKLYRMDSNGNEELIGTQS